MAIPDRRDITRTLERLTGGDRAAINELLPLVYDELRALAARQLEAERAGHTLQATALVHEAYLRLVADEDRSWANRAHFYATAATAIRRILIDHARKRARLKRGGDLRRVEFDESMSALDYEDRLVDLDDALTRLAEIDPQKARVVELRFFAGLQVEEAAAVLDVSASTIARSWRVARAWLRSEMEEVPPDGS